MIRWGLILFMLAFSSTGVSQSFESRFLEAETEYKKGSFKNAGKLLTELFKKYPNKPKVIEKLALVYFQRRDLSKAREMFEKMPASALTREAGYAWGASFYEAKEWRKAAYGFKKVPRVLCR